MVLKFLVFKKLKQLRVFYLEIGKYVSCGVPVIDRPRFLLIKRLLVSFR